MCHWKGSQMWPRAHSGRHCPSVGSFLKVSWSRFIRQQEGQWIKSQTVSRRQTWRSFCEEQLDTAIVECLTDKTTRWQKNQNMILIVATALGTAEEGPTKVSLWKCVLYGPILCSFPICQTSVIPNPNVSCTWWVYNGFKTVLRANYKYVDTERAFLIRLHYSQKALRGSHPPFL